MWSCTTFPVSFVALWENSLPTLVCGNVGKCVKCTTCLSHKPGTPFLESNIHKTECTYLNDNEAYLPCRQKQWCEVCIFHQASDELFHDDESGDFARYANQKDCYQLNGLHCSYCPWATLTIVLLLVSECVK